MTNRRFPSAALALALLATGCGGTAPPEDAAGGASEAPATGTSAATLTSEEDKTLYALGAVLGRNVPPLVLDARQRGLVQRGFADAAAEGDLLASPKDYQQQIQKFVQSRQQAAVGREKEKGAAFARDAAGQAGAQTTDSGLVIRTLTPGSGASPGAQDTVRVHYVGTLVDGTQFDSSRDRGEPTEFRLDQVVPCWGEGLQKMKVGETARLVCPSDIAYGDQGRPPVIQPGATLVFEVELLDVVK